jgi:predicted dehydrogenase
MDSEGASTIRVGLIGTGQIGTVHIEKYSHMPDVEIVAVCDIDEPKMQRVAGKYGITNLYKDFRQLLARDDIEAVDICLHNNLHAPATIAALEAGKDVYCEKPMAGSFLDAETMLKSAQRLGRRLSIQLNTLFAHEVRAAKELIDAGAVGKIYHARSAGFRRRGRPYVDGYGSINFVQKDISAGGALYDMGVYHIARTLYLIGNPPVERISGKTYQEMPMDAERQASSGYNVEELGLGFVRMANNLTFDIVEAWAVQQEKFEGSMIFGSQGGIRLEPFGYYSSIGDVDLNASVDLDKYKRRKALLRANNDAYESAQHHWIGALQGRVELLPSAELALNTMLISQGIYLSEQLGREVTVDEVRELTHSTAIKI